MHCQPPQSSPLDICQKEDCLTRCVCQHGVYSIFDFSYLPNSIMIFFQFFDPYLRLSLFFSFQLILEDLTHSLSVLFSHSFSSSLSHFICFCITYIIPIIIFIIIIIITIENVHHPPISYTVQILSLFNIYLLTSKNFTESVI